MNYKRVIVIRSMEKKRMSVTRGCLLVSEANKICFDFLDILRSRSDGSCLAMLMRLQPWNTKRSQSLITENSNNFHCQKKSQVRKAFLSIHYSTGQKVTMQKVVKSAVVFTRVVL